MHGSKWPDSLKRTNSWGDFFLRCHVCVPSKIDRQYLAQEIYSELFGLVERHLHQCLLCSFGLALIIINSVLATLTL